MVTDSLRSPDARDPAKRAGRVLMFTEMALLCGVMCVIFALIGPSQTSNQNVSSFDDPITHVALDPSGRSLFVRKAFSEMGTLDLVTGTYRALGRYNSQCIVSVCAARRHHRLLACLHGFCVELFEDRRLLTRYCTSTSAVSALTFAPDGEAYLVLDDTCVARIDLDSEEILVKEFDLLEPAIDACVTNDFFVALSATAVNIYQRTNGQRISGFPVPAGVMGTPICSEDGTRLLISFGSAISCYDLSTGTRRWSITEFSSGTFICLAAIPSNPDLVATSGFDGIRLIDASTGTYVSKIGDGIAAPSIAVSPAGDLIYAGGPNGKVTVWSTDTGMQVNQIATGKRGQGAPAQAGGL